MQRLITRMPLTELWDDDGVINAARKRDLDTDQILSLLRAGRVRFVVADLESPPKWVPESDCFDFWKTEARRHISDQPQASLEDFPDQYFYFAAEWEPPTGLPIILLERHH